MRKVILIIVIFTQLPMFAICKPLVVNRKALEKKLFVNTVQKECTEGEFKILEEIFVRLEKKYIDDKGVLSGFFFEYDSNYYGFIVLRYDQYNKIKQIDVYNFLDTRINDRIIPTFSMPLFQSGEELIMLEPFTRRLFFICKGEINVLESTTATVDQL